VEAVSLAVLGNCFAARSEPKVVSPESRENGGKPAAKAFPSAESTDSVASRPSGRERKGKTRSPKPSSSPSSSPPRPVNCARRKEGRLYYEQASTCVLKYALKRRHQ